MVHRTAAVSIRRWLLNFMDFCLYLFIFASRGYVHITLSVSDDGARPQSLVTLEGVLDALIYVAL